MYPHRVKHSGNLGSHARVSPYAVPLLGYMHPKLMDIVIKMWQCADISRYEWPVMVASRERKFQ
jgi:hypothetical protein